MINQTCHGRHGASWQGFASPSGTSSHGAPEHSLAHGPARLSRGFSDVFPKGSKVSTSIMESIFIRIPMKQPGFSKKIGNVFVWACV